MPASLLGDMTHSEVSSTLQILGEHGVTEEDLKFLRQFRGAFAESVARAIKQGNELFKNATKFSVVSVAVRAVGQIDDVDILKKVYELSPMVSVWVAVLEKLKNEDDIYHLIRIYSGPERWDAQLVGVRKLSQLHLGQLWYDDGYIALDVLSRRRKLVTRVEEERKHVNMTPEQGHYE